MTATVIDQLVVRLGLDPKDFTKGEKEAAASMLRVKKAAKDGLGAVGDEAENAAKSFAASGGVIGRIASRAGPIGIALGAMVVGAKLAADKIYDVAENVRALGLTAKNFDTSAAGLRNMQNAAELAGGSMEDATASIGGLKKALFDLKFNGQVSDQIVALARLGVNPNQSYEKVAGDAADALARGQKSGTFTQGEAIFYAQQAGFQGGLAQLVATGGRGGVDAALAKQAGRRQITASDFATATDVVTSSQSRDQAAFAELGVRGLAGLGGAQAAGSREVEGAINGVGHAAEYVTHALEGLGDKLAGGAATAGGYVSKGLSKLNPYHSQFYYQGQIDKVASKYGIEPRVLAGVLNTESGFNPNAVNAKSGATGIAQLNPKYFPNAGKNANADIDTAGGLLKRLHDAALADGNDSDAAWYVALQGYNAGASRVKNSANYGGSGAPLTPETLAYPGKVLSTPGAQGGAGSVGGSSTIQIDSITVNTQATDADGIAGDMRAAIDRKLTAAHAETGQQ